MKRLWLLVMLLLTTIFVQAQPNIVVTAGNVSACTGDTVLVPISTTGANGVAAISLALNYDSQNLIFDGVANASTQISNGLLANATGGKVIASWFSVNPINLNGGVLFQARFIVQGASSLQWDLTTPGNCEFADLNGDTISAAYTNGALSLSGAAITAQPAGNTQIQENGSTSFAVAATGASSYQWQVLNGQLWDNLQNNNIYGGSTTDVLAINNAPFSLNNSTYRVLVFGSCPQPVVSNPISLTVTSAGPTNSVDLPITWDDPTVAYAFTDFGGTVSTLAADPTNASNMTLMTEKTIGAQTWAGTTVSPPAGLATAIPFAIGFMNISVKVYAPAANRTIRLKVEELGNPGVFSEVDAMTTTVGWQTLAFDFTTAVQAVNFAVPYKMMSIFYDFGNAGTGDIYYVDSISLVASSTPVVSLIELPITWDDPTLPYAFTDFGGNVSMLTQDPTNASNTVLMTDKVIGAQTWAGTTVSPPAGLMTAIPFAPGVTDILMRVYAPAANRTIMVKVEELGNPGVFAEVQAISTTAGWQTLSFDFALAVPAINFAVPYKMISIFYDFGNAGSGEIYYVDSISLGGSSAPVNGIELPITWDDPTLTYTFTDFGGNSSTLAADPTNASNMTLMTEKTIGAQTWAGTTVSPPAGLATAIPFATGATTISAKIYAPAANKAVLMKVEEFGNPAVNAEVQMTTTGAGWQTLSFDFAAASPALNFGTSYKVLSIFYDFGNPGAGDIYYVDSIYFGVPAGGGGPSTTISLPTNITACTGDTVLVPVNTSGINGVAAVSLAFDYNSQHLIYDGVVGVASNLASGLLANATNGKFIASWFSVNPTTLNSGQLFAVRFIVQGSSGLQWDLATAGNCEIADLNGDPIAVAYLNGAINASGATITSQPTGNTQIQENGSTSFSVAASGASGYQWQVLNGQLWDNLQDNNIYGGSTTDVLAINNAPLSLDNSTYRVLVFGSCPQPTISNPISLTVTGQTPVSPISLPITWDDPTLTYTVTDFGGTASMLAADPTNASNMTLMTEKTIGAQTWAGTTMSPPAGLATAIPFATGATTISAKIYAPAANKAVLMKVEEFDNPTVFAEVQMTTTGAGWQTLSFDFAAASPALNFGTSYKVLSIFYDFGNPGAGDIYYVDSIYLGVPGGGGPSATISVPANSIACVGDTILVPVLNTDFSGVAAISLALFYNDQNLFFDGFVNPNPAIANGLLVNANAGRVFASWFSVNPVNLTPGTLFEMRFVVQGNSNLQWDLATAGNCEIADLNGDPFAVNFVNGQVNLTGGASIIDQPFGNTSIQEGSSTVFTVDASGASGYQWQQLVGTNFVDLQEDAVFSGVTGPQLAISNATLALNNSKYRVLVFSSCGAPLTSNVITLFVNPAQGAPIETYLAAGSACLGDTLEVDVMVDNLNSIGAISLVLNFDPQAMQFVGVKDVNQALGNNVVVNGNPDNISFAWFDVNPLSLSNASSLLTYQFVVSGSSALVWDTLTSGNCEYADLNGNVVNANFTGLAVQPLPPIQIVAQPSNQVVSSSDTAVFAIQANNVAAYQWQRLLNGQWNNLVDNPTFQGTNSAALRVVADPLLSGSVYRVELTGNCVGFEYSQSVNLTVASSALTIEASIGNFTGCVGQQISVPILVTNFNDVSAFSLTLEYDTSLLELSGFLPNVSVQNGLIVNSLNSAVRASWFAINPVTIGNGTLLTLQFTAKALGQSGLVWNTTTQGANEIADFNGDVILTNFTNGGVSITGAAPVITQQPAAQTVLEGDTANFTVVATNATAYQWQVLNGSQWVDLTNTAPYSGVNSAVLQIANVPIALNGNQYRVQVSSNCPPAIVSQAATLSVTPNVASISFNLADYTVCAGGTLSIPINVQNFNNVATFSIRILYDQTKLTYTGLSNIAQPFQVGLASGANNGRLSMSWFSINPANIANGTLFNANFTVNGSSTLVWDTVSAGSGTVGDLLGNQYPRFFTNGNVTANPAPQITFQNIPNICINQGAVMLSATPVGGSFSGPGVAQSEFVPANAGIGTHTLIYTFTDSLGCTASATRSVTVLPAPNGSAGPDQTICIGQSATLLATGGTSYLWSNGATTASITVNPIVTTTYTVQISNAAGCSITDSVQVVIFNDPNMNAGVDVSICAGGSAQLQASGALQYFWTPSTGLSANNVPNPVASPAVTTTYIVAGLSSSGCVSLDTMTVFVNPRPAINAGADQTVCGGVAVQLNATGGVSYSWSPAAGLSATNIANPLANPTVSTNYIVTGTDSNGCTNVDTIRVLVPVLNPGANRTICQGGSTTMNARITGIGPNPGTSYSWSPATGLSATNIANPVANPNTTTTYTVTATTAAGCVLSASVSVIVNPTPVVDAGLNISIAPGASITLGGTASGGTTPYNISWSPVASLSAGNIFTPVATPTATTTYYLTVTGSNGCSSVDSVVVTVDSNLLGKNILGKLVYDNAAFSPLNAGSVALNYATGANVGNVTVDVAGNYLFQNLPDSSYVLRGTTTKPWGGVTSGDALLINNYFADPTTLTGLQVLAADVNGDQAINSTDALLTLQRSINAITSFPAGDWVYSSDTFALAGADVIRNARALCVGDANASYNPGLRILPKVLLMQAEFTGVPARGQVKVPMYVNEAINVGSYQFELTLHPGDVLVDIVIPGRADKPIFAQYGQHVKLGWFTSSVPLDLDADDMLMQLTIQTSGFGAEGIPFEVVGQSELTDMQANVYSMVGVRTPVWTSSVLGAELGLRNYPNPAKDFTDILYSLPHDGEVKLSVTDMTGRLIDMPVNQYQSSGNYELRWDANSLAPGMYFIRLELFKEGDVAVRNERMIIQK